MRRLMTVLICAVLTAPALTGCKAGVKTASDNMKMALLAPAVDIDPPSAPEKNRVWVGFQDQSGQGINLRSEIVAAVEQKGYQATSDFKNADYELRATLRIFDKAGEGTNDTIARLGPIAGGAAIGTAVGVATDSVGWGIGAGVVGGAVATPIMQYLARTNAYAMVVDVRLGRRLETGPIETVITTGANRRSDSSVNAGVPFGMESGRSSTTSSAEQEVVERRDRLEYPQRIVATTHGPRLERSIARQAMVPRISNSLSEMLP